MSHALRVQIYRCDASIQCVSTPVQVIQVTVALAPILHEVNKESLTTSYTQVPF